MTYEQAYEFQIEEAKRQKILDDFIERTGEYGIAEQAKINSSGVDDLILELDRLSNQKPMQAPIRSCEEVFNEFRTSLNLSLSLDEEFLQKAVDQVTLNIEDVNFWCVVKDFYNLFYQEWLTNQVKPEEEPEKPEVKKPAKPPFPWWLLLVGAGIIYYDRKS